MKTYLATAAKAAIGVGLAITSASLMACGSPDSNGVDGGAHSVDAAPVAKNAIPLSSPQGEYYTAKLTIGTQTFALDLDTGSSTTGIASNTCTSCTNAGITTLYTPGSTATATGMAAQAQYGDGSGWSGTVYADHVGLKNGTPDVPLDLVAITSQNGFFRSADYQGILGLGPPELLARGTTSYFSAIGSAGLTPEMAFEFCESTGTMWLGDFDESAAASPVQFTASRESGQNPFYSVNMTDMGIDGVSLGFGDDTFQDPIVDTGTSLFYIPGTVIDALATKVTASTGFQQLFPNQTLSPSSNQGCVQAKSGTTDAMINAILPKMSMSFPTADGGAVFSVSVDAANSYLYAAGDLTYCLSIQDDQGQGAIMGDSILRSMITVINTQTNQIGFATDKNCTVGETSDRSRETTVRLRTEHGHPFDHRRHHTTK